MFPYIHVFGVGYGKSDEPRRGYVLAFAICCCMILIGKSYLVSQFLAVKRFKDSTYKDSNITQGSILNVRVTI